MAMVTMHTFIEDGEVMIAFPDGTTTYVSVVDQVLALLDGGHSITVSDDGDVTVTPAVPADTLDGVLGPNWTGVAAVVGLWRAAQGHGGNNADADE